MKYRIFILLIITGMFSRVLIVPRTSIAHAQQASPQSDNATTTEESPPIPTGPSREELEAKIKERSDALEKINKELESTSQNLLSTKSQKSTLQRELQGIQSNISQLELTIQADDIASQKLALEVESLNYDIRDIEVTSGDKTAAIAYVLREMQKSADQNMLLILLRNVSLADSVWEAQSLKNLRNQLAVDIASLARLQSQMQDKLKLVSSKRVDIEQRQKNLTARKYIAEDQKEARSALLQQTKSKESAYQKQLEELKKQQDDISEEIAEVEEQLRAAFDTGLLPAKRSGVFSWPVQMVSEGGKGRITQHFGEKSNLYRGKPHNGLDIGAPVGTPVYAAADGVISRVDNNDRSKWQKYQYGKYVLIRHNNNLSTLYSHLSSYTVAAGQEVKRGELIGYVGATGYATGPHLHFGAYWSASVQLKSIPPAAGLVPIGVIVSPEDYL